MRLVNARAAAPVVRAVVGRCVRCNAETFAVQLPEQERLADVALGC